MRRLPFVSRDEWIRITSVKDDLKPSHVFRVMRRYESHLYRRRETVYYKMIIKYRLMKRQIKFNKIGLWTDFNSYHDTNTDEIVRRYI